MKVIIYGDFKCLYCHLSSQRADRLVRAGTANVEWRAAEHRPGLPVTGAKPPPDGAGRDDDMAEAARLALPGDWLPAAVPAVVTNTRAAVSAYALLAASRAPGFDAVTDLGDRGQGGTVAARPAAPIDYTAQLAAPVPGLLPAPVPSDAAASVEA